MNYKLMTMIIGGVMLGVGYPVAADAPNWNWQASYTLDSNGNVLTSSLDLEGTKWLSCLEANLAIVLDTSVSTSDQSISETDRMDSANFYLEKVRQENGQVRTTRWHCSLGGQEIDPPAPVQTTCSVGMLGSACGFVCSAGSSVYVRVTTAVKFHVTAECGNSGILVCDGLLAVSSAIGGCLKARVTTISGGGACGASLGIYYSAGCGG